jgi:hypothetical protein
VGYCVVQYIFHTFFISDESDHITGILLFTAYNLVYHHLFQNGHILICMTFDSLTAESMTIAFDTSSWADRGNVSEKYVESRRKGFCIGNIISKPGLPLSPENGSSYFSKRRYL